jgi:hypothetical protein
MSQFPSKTNPSKIKIYRCKIPIVITCMNFDTRLNDCMLSERHATGCVTVLPIFTLLCCDQVLVDSRNAYVTQFSNHLNIWYTQCNVGYMHVGQIFIV